MFKKIVAISALTTLIAGGVYAAGVDSALIVRPKGSSAFEGEQAALLAKGEQLWNDKSLSKKGNTACASCQVTRPVRKLQ